MSGKQQRGRPKRTENDVALRIHEPTKNIWDECRKQSSQTHNEFASYLLGLHARYGFESMSLTDNHQGHSSEEQFKTDSSAHTTIPLSSTSDIHQGQEAYGVPTVPDSDQKFKVIYQNGKIFSKEYIDVGFNDYDQNHDVTILLKKSIGGIGYGKYSLCQVYIGNETYAAAIKLIKLTKQNREEILKNLQDWNKTRPNLDKQHIILPEFVLERNDCLVQVMQTISLRQYINKLLYKHKEESGCEKVYHFDCHGSMIIPEMLRLLANIISGVATLQKHGLFQSHINTDTIILTGDDCVMIALDESIYLPGFIPPEAYEDKTDSKSILFSLGCCIAEIAGLCSMVVDPIGKTKEQITEEVYNRNNKIGFLMNTSSRLVSYGISNMFVMSTKHSVEERGSIDDLLSINVVALLQMRTTSADQQLPADSTNTFKPTKNYTQTQPFAETYTQTILHTKNKCKQQQPTLTTVTDKQPQCQIYDADMQPEEQGNTFTMEQMFANRQPNLPTDDFAEQHLSKYTYMQPQLLRNTFTEQQPSKDAYTQLQLIQLVTCMQQLQSHEIYKQQQSTTETYMETESAMETHTHPHHTMEMDTQQHHTMETDTHQQNTLGTYTEQQYTVEADTQQQNTSGTYTQKQYTVEADTQQQNTLGTYTQKQYTVEADTQQQNTSGTYTQQQLTTKTDTLQQHTMKTYMQQQNTLGTYTQQHHTLKTDTQQHHTMETDTQQQHTTKTHTQLQHTMKTYEQHKMETYMQQQHKIESDAQVQLQLCDTFMQLKEQGNTFTEKQPTENTDIESQPQIENETTMDAWFRKYLEQPYPTYDDYDTDFFEQPG